jgi:integrase
MMPSSKKGKGTKRVTRQPVPIPQSLAVRLHELARERSSGTSLLLLRPSGEPWIKASHSRLFARAAKRAGQDPGETTIYALRHSSITRQLLLGTPIRVTAVLHDTSVAMIERTYSKFIGDHSDALARPALLDLAAPAIDNVVRLGGRS